MAGVSFNLSPQAAVDVFYRYFDGGNLQTEFGEVADRIQDLYLAGKKKEAIAKGIYGADGVDYSPTASKAIEQIEGMGFGNTPVCMAKTQYSFSDDATKLGRPSGFRLTVRDAYVSAGAGFVVALAGDIMTMPGLSKTPSAENIRVLADGTIEGLF